MTRNSHHETIDLEEARAALEELQRQVRDLPPLHPERLEQIRRYNHREAVRDGTWEVQ